MHRRPFLIRFASILAAPLALLGWRKAEATVVPVEPPKPDIEQLAAEWVYARIREYEDATRASGKYASSITWGGVEKSVAFVAGILRERKSDKVSVPFYTGLAYWCAELEVIPVDAKPVIYEATFNFYMPGRCRAVITFGLGKTPEGYTSILRV